VMGKEEGATGGKVANLERERKCDNLSEVLLTPNSLLPDGAGPEIKILLLLHRQLAQHSFHDFAGWSLWHCRGTACQLLLYKEVV
jgi:hypothetical protein